VATFIDDSFEDPTTRGEIGELVLEGGVDSAATSPRSELQEPGVGHIPTTIKELQIARGYRERISSSKFSKRPKRDAGGLSPQLACEPRI
jgi:hypothetical protein